METPWTPNEIKMMKEFKDNIPSWNPKTQHSWLEMERLLTYSETLRKMTCSCQVGAVKDKVMNMLNKASSTIDELYVKYWSEGEKK